MTSFKQMLVYEGNDILQPTQALDDGVPRLQAKHHKYNLSVGNTAETR